MEHIDDEHEQQPRVLFVDGGRSRPCASLLKSKSRFRMRLAENGCTALEVLRREPVDVIIIDADMPDVAAPYLLAAIQELSPATAAVVLTDNADHRLNEAAGLLRTLPTSCSEETLRVQIQTLIAEIRDAAARAITAERIDPFEQLADDILSQRMPETVRAQAAELHSDFARTMTEQELASTDVLDSDPDGDAAPVVGLRRKSASAANVRSGVVVFSADPAIIQCVADAADARFPLFIASNIVQVVKILKAHAPGVLVTDVAEDRNTIAAMTARLKFHVAALVTIVVSGSRDPAEMAWLINHGHIFRFLRKPVSAGRCAVCLQAALQHHEALRAQGQAADAIDNDRKDGATSAAASSTRSSP